ncbi:Auxin-responsive protein SAUR36 [Carex littledalei]|uniref:Auxin-responsive protein SAUR36 n=1 Tax=Carex littledalei TaxID=544730 RepID=A0A833QSC5_9POAL|nr:Auxin-responsive protein SAUR36 [Carex littledalei]
MLSPKKLVQMAKKWQRMAVLGRRRLTFERNFSHRYADQCTSPRVEKGHFVVYTIDEKRFMIPLDYLNTRIIMQLFQLSEEEFGYTVDGPITVPCEAAFMEYAMELIKRGVSEEVERALLSSLLVPCHHACSAQINFGATSQQVEVCGF